MEDPQQRIARATQTIWLVLASLILTMTRKELLSPEEARSLIEEATGPLHDAGVTPDTAVKALLQKIDALGTE